ncbi:MAG: hypothetical protein GY790_17980 [Bacteroidetes bacterium]|nr:hypothetical protein [Bacteroidota bacterium]
MKLIKPSEISAKILTLLDESDERVILVSPYLKISKWYKFIKKVNGLKVRKINPEIYVRDDPDNTATYRDLDQLALQYKKIPNLHSKLYMNERYGIVTSMNLLLSSEINSLEIGYVTETWTEYNDLLGFYHRYIHIGEPVYCATIDGRPAADLKEIMNNIREELKRTAKNSRLWLAENALHICTGRNNYNVSINDGLLRVNACLRIASGTKQEGIQPTSLTSKKAGDLSALIAKKVEDLTAMKVDVRPGDEPDILQLSGQAQQTLKSTFITGILEAEAAYMMESVIRFIDATDDLVFQEAFYLFRD